MSYKETIENTVTYPDLDEEEKQSLRDNPHTWRVFVTKTVTEEYVVEASSKDEAEYQARDKSENHTRPEGWEVEDVTVDSSELDRCTYLQEEIDFLEEEVL